MDYPNPSRGLRDLVAGTEIEVPVLNGTRRRYINFDNAASSSLRETGLSSAINTRMAVIRRARDEPGAANPIVLLVF